MSVLPVRDKKNAATYKTFTITIPEDLDDSSIFDDILGEYTSIYDLARVKTTNTGSMFRLTYNVTLRDVSRERKMIDKLRYRNGKSGDHRIQAGDYHIRTLTRRNTL